MGERLRISASDGHELSAYVSRPDGAPKGGLVVVQEIFGMNAHIRSIVDGFAKDGYLAIAPSLFDRVQENVELGYDGGDLKKAFGLYQKLDPATAILDVAAAFHEVQAESGGVGVVGYCYGGFMSWLSATRGPSTGFRPKACVGYYAGGIGTVAKEEPSCPVMLHFGGKDDHIGTDQIDAVRSAHAEVEIYVYDGAAHGFNCDVRGSYDPEAAALARQRTLTFFNVHIG